MNVIDLNEESTVAILLYPAAKSATFDGTGVDVTAYTGVLKITQVVGTVSGTPTLIGKLSTSDDDTTYTDVTGAVFTTVTAANKSYSIGVDTRGLKKYLRYTGTISGGTPSLTMDVSFAGQQVYQ